MLCLFALNAVPISENIFADSLRVLFLVVCFICLSVLLWITLKTLILTFLISVVSLFTSLFRVSLGFLVLVLAKTFTYLNSIDILQKTGIQTKDMKTKYVQLSSQTTEESKEKNIVRVKQLLRTESDELYITSDDEETKTQLNHQSLIPSLTGASRLFSEKPLNILDKPNDFKIVAGSIILTNDVPYDFGVVTNGRDPHKSAKWERCPNCKNDTKSLKYHQCDRSQRLHVLDSAWEGDAQHRVDVITYLRYLGYHSSISNSIMTTYISSEAQAAYMKAIGEYTENDGIDRNATRFEAFYNISVEFRTDYWLYIRKQHNEIHAV